jgi:hypothetical protein
MYLHRYVRPSYTVKTELICFYCTDAITLQINFCFKRYVVNLLALGEERIFGRHLGRTNAFSLPWA